MLQTIISHLPYFAAVGDKCNPSGGGFLGLPKWYQYLDGVREAGGNCAPKLGGINDIWLIGLAVVDILLRVVVLVAIAFILIGGFYYITSRANPDKTKNARNTVIDALIGLTIAVVAIAVISFVAGRFKG
jgi:ABC-type Fe3+ transport system permease subunit